MAKQFRALSNIEHGVDHVDAGSGQAVNEITHIPYGAIVEGLDKDTMKNLWDAGVLEEVESAPPVVTKSVTTKPAGDGAAGGGKTSEGSETPPAAPKNTEGVAPSSTGGKA